jgi:galactan 5-O-arabinofuranosyltransferase
MRRRWLTTIEIATSFVAAAVFTFVFSRVHANALDRIGQVSGMATIALRFLMVAVPLVVALGVSARVKKGAAFDTTARLVCAALAGVASAAFAGGILFALRGTPFGIGGTSGDAGVLCQWADSVNRGDNSFSSVYPPLQVHLLAVLSRLFDMPTAHMIKFFQVIGVAAIGPAAYAAWRLLMRPGWALAIAVVSMMPQIEPYRPYAGLVLVVFLPVLIKFLDTLQTVGTLSLQRVMQYAAIFGAGLGFLCLLYSGWYQWSAPGFAVAVLVAFPWRDWRRGTLFCGIAAVVFGLCVLHYVMGFRAGSGIKDTWFSFDAQTDPMYFGNLRGGTQSRWLPLGEIGGVGVLTLILVVGIGIALTLGRRRNSVVALVSILGGCWALRLWHASRMWETKLVQLWPRTSAEILCCMVLLSLIAIHLLIERCESTSIWRSRQAMIAGITGLVFVIMSSSAAVTDLYVATNTEGTFGWLTWIAHQLSRKRPSIGRTAEISTSSSIESAKFSAHGLNDGDLNTFYSSEPSPDEDHEVSIEFRWSEKKLLNRVILYPAADGYPSDVAFDVWDDDKYEWVEVRQSRYLPEPYGGFLIELGHAGETFRFRMRVTKMRKLEGSDDYVVRLGEIELH